MKRIVLEGNVLDDLLDELRTREGRGTPGYVYKLTIAVDEGGAIAFKVNEAMWSPPYPAEVTP